MRSSIPSRQLCLHILHSEAISSMHSEYQARGATTGCRWRTCVPSNLLGNALPDHSSTHQTCAPVLSYETVHYKRFAVDSSSSPYLHSTRVTDGAHNERMGPGEGWQRCDPKAEHSAAKATVFRSHHPTCQQGKGHHPRTGSAKQGRMSKSTQQWAQQRRRLRSGRTCAAEQ